MDLEPIKIASFAGLIASKSFILVKMVDANTVVIAHSYRKAVKHVNRMVVQLLPGLARLAEQSQEQIRIAMPTTIEAAFLEYLGDIAFRLKHSASFLQIPTIIQSSNDGCGHHFSCCHLALHIIFVAKCFQHVVMEAINRDNSGVRVSSWSSCGVVTNNCTRGHMDFVCHLCRVATWIRRSYLQLLQVPSNGRVVSPTHHW